MHALILAAVLVTDLLAHMAAPNAGLNSYEVPVHFDVDLHSMLSLHTGLDGTAYFKRPDKSAVNFDTVPILADAFKHLAGTLGTPETWPQTYDLTVNSDTELKLVPKKSGNVSAVIVDVDPSDFGIVRERWLYKDGGSIDVRETNATVGGFLLPRRQIGDFNLTQYKAHVVTDYGAYKLNIAIPDSVFAK
jgi:hypothetical protein